MLSLTPVYAQFCATLFSVSANLEIRGFEAAHQIVKKLSITILDTYILLYRNLMGNKSSTTTFSK